VLAMNVPQGKGWSFVLVERLSVRLSCGHVVLVPKDWILPDGKAAAGLQCNQGLCRRVTYDAVLENWEARP
jgi:hypothetical protein